jgi:hypothetical protein
MKTRKEVVAEARVAGDTYRFRAGRMFIAWVEGCRRRGDGLKEGIVDLRFAIVYALMAQQFGLVEARVSGALPGPNFEGECEQLLEDVLAYKPSEEVMGRQMDDLASWCEDWLEERDAEQERREDEKEEKEARAAFLATPAGQHAVKAGIAEQIIRVERIRDAEHGTCFAVTWLDGASWPERAEERAEEKAVRIVGVERTGKNTIKVAIEGEEP